jgi:hypothetical protein
MFLSLAARICRAWGSGSPACEAISRMGVKPIPTLAASAIGTVVAQQRLRSVLGCCNSPETNAPGAYNSAPDALGVQAPVTSPP